MDAAKPILSDFKVATVAHLVSQSLRNTLSTALGHYYERVKISNR